MGILLALGAALAYGASDFLAGLQSRRASAYAVAVAAQCAGALSVLLAALLLPAAHPTGSAMAWGAASGIGSGLGTLFLYRGFGSGRMSVVAPVSAVGSAGLPVIVGVALGDRPSALAIIGIVLALPAVALISRGESGIAGGTAGRSGLADGLLAGGGFALLFIALGQVPASAGLWPLVVGQLLSTGVIVIAARFARAELRAGARATGGAAIAGALGGVATVLYLLATHYQLLSIAAVVTSLYPALTVLAAMVVLHERVSRGQAIGLAAATAAVILIALS